MLHIRALYLAISLLVVIFFIAAPIVSARTESFSDVVKTPKNQVEKNLKNLPIGKEASDGALRKFKEKEFNATQAALLKEDAIGQIKKHWQIAKARLQEAIDRQENISRRLSNLISKAKERGQDVSQAEKALGNASTNIAQAKTTLAAIDAKVATLTTVTTPEEKRAVVQDITSQTKALKKLLIDSHKQLESIIPIIKRTLPKTATGSAVKRFGQINQATEVNTNE